MSIASQPAPDAARSRRSAHLSRTRPAVIAWRRHLHSHPELSFQEHETARYIAATLAELGLTPTSPTTTSVVADLDGAKPGRTIAVRADIDALPITEDTGLPFSSQRSDVMHACGHDGHAAALLGVAAVLSAGRAELAGRVRLIFQHAEECPPHGAPGLIAAGALDGVEAIIGQHLFPALPLGVVGVSRGLMMASSDRFEIRFTGRGGHGAMPHEGRDPVAAAAELVHAVQRLVAREIDPRQTAVASITRIRAGDALNVIPATAEVGGSLRAFDRGVRAELRERIVELSEQVAATHRMGAHVAFDTGLPPLVNTGAITEVIEHIVQDAGLELQMIDPITGSEDFACYLERVPGAYVFVGARPSGVSEPFPHHHPRFDIHEDALTIATTVLAEAAASLADPLTTIGDTGSAT
jgi:amidohydrolase